MYGQCDYICKLCPRLIISDSVTVVTVDSVDTLVIDIPAATYSNGCKYCIVIAQAIPATATINMPVAISIGGDTTTVYPLTTKCCTQVVACQIHTRTRYAVRVATTGTGGTFKVLGCLPCAPNTVLASLPVAAAAAASMSTMSATPTATKVANSSATPKKATTPKTVSTMTVKADTVTISKEAE